MLYIFHGSQDFWATTEDSTGANLPAEYAPWTLCKTVDRDDPRANSGLDAGTLEEIDARGFLLRQITVTFEISTTKQQS